jgi:tRNA(Ile)-lysidine synthase
VHAPTTAPFAVAWEGAPEVKLPGGILAFERAAGDGLALAKIAGAPVTVRSRLGGERIKLAINRPRRSVKKLLQEARLSQWQRQALPLVWCGDMLAAVPGIGVDLAFQAGRDEPSWNLAWLPFGRGS